MKILQTTNDLAINGSEPMFNDPHYVGKPNIGDKDYFISLVNEMFERKRFTNDGPLVKELEDKLSKFLNVKYAFAVCNATIGLEIAARALSLKGEVIVPSFTFVATAHCLKWLGIKPIFVDIDPLTCNINPDSVKKAITPRTSGILGVHLWGRPCDVEALEKIAKEHNIQLFFDAAHAFGCSYKNNMIGNFGRCEVFSFHATKFFNTFEGGLITTNDPILAGKIKVMRNFGFTGVDKVESVGTNGKMTEVCAAFGLTNFVDYENITKTNDRNYNLYKKCLNDVNGISVIEYNLNEISNYSYIIIKIDKEVYGISRDRLGDILNKENIMARRYFYPGAHKMEPYLTDDFYKNIALPITDEVCKEVLALPTGKNVNENDIKHICDLIKFVGSNSDYLK